MSFPKGTSNVFFSAFVIGINFRIFSMLRRRI